MTFDLKHRAKTRVTPTSALEFLQGTMAVGTFRTLRGHGAPGPCFLAYARNSWQLSPGALSKLNSVPRMTFDT